jgi:hypothetical protein
METHRDGFSRAICMQKTTIVTLRRCRNETGAPSMTENWAKPKKDWKKGLGFDIDVAAKNRPRTISTRTA